MHLAQILVARFNSQGRRWNRYWDRRSVLIKVADASATSGTTVNSHATAVTIADDKGGDVCGKCNEQRHADGFRRD